MPQVINIPGLEHPVRFPDSMSDGDIEKAIKGLMPSTPVSSQQTGAQIEAGNTGVMQAPMIAAGKKTSDILNGLTQLYLKSRGENSALGGLEKNVQAENQVYAPLKQKFPIATGLGETLPALAVPGAGAGYAGAAMAGAIPELLSYGDTNTRLASGAVGAVGGMGGRAFGGAVSTLLKPAGMGVYPNKAGMDAAAKIGYSPLPGAATQNPALSNIENYLSRSAGSSTTMREIAQKNIEALNSAATKSIGQIGTELSPAVLNAAQKTIGSDFARLQSITAPHIGNDFVNSLVKIESANAARGPFRLSEVDKLLDKGMDLAAQGNLSGTAYKEIRSALSGEASKAFTAGNAPLGQAYKEVRTALDEAAKQSLSKTDQKAWKVAREQWSNWKTLTKGNVAEAGDVSAARVAAQLRADKAGPGFRTGTRTGDLVDVGRIGEAFKGPLNPNSGALMHTVPSALMSPANYVAGQIYTSPLMQRYLRAGLLDIGRSGELALKEAGMPFGIAGIRGLLGVE
jgi:hypothetical protein